MKNCKMLIFVLTALSMFACGKNEPHPSATPADLMVQIDTVRPSMIRFSILPGNEHTCYAFSLYQHEAIAGMTEQQLKEQETSFLNGKYNNFAEENPSLSYKDMLLYSGKHTFTQRHLVPDKDYDMLLFQMDPDRHVIVGGINQTAFHTPAIDSVKISFEAVVKGDSLHIFPSDKNVTYIFDYDLEEDIMQVFFSPYGYYRSMVEMYEDYGFIDTQTCRGDLHLSFTHDGKAVGKGADYLLVIAAYNGEICSDISVICFTPEP